VHDGSTSNCVNAWCRSTPNILFILADTIGYGDIGAYGGGELRRARWLGRCRFDKQRLNNETRSDRQCVAHLPPQSKPFHGVPPPDYQKLVIRLAAQDAHSGRSPAAHRLPQFVRQKDVLPIIFLKWRDQQRLFTIPGRIMPDQRRFDELARLTPPLRVDWHSIKRNAYQTRGREFIGLNFSKLNN
jgi:hypothetical protein